MYSISIDHRFNSLFENVLTVHVHILAPVYSCHY